MKNISSFVTEILNKQCIPPRFGLQSSAAVPVPGTSSSNCVIITRQGRSPTAYHMDLSPKTIIRWSTSI
jgi:hypothetical protein